MSTVETAVNAEQLPELIIDVLQAGLVPSITSSPGIGKSDVVKQVCKKFNLKLIDIRLSQADPTDLLGYPSVVNGRSTFNPPIDFPIEGDVIPDGYDGWCIFFDEITSAPLSVQSAAYKIILDRMVGQHHLHKNVAMIAAGNELSDKAVVNRMSTALQSRMVHFKLKVDHKVWIKWADNNGIDHRIKGFIGFRPELLHKFDPNHDDKTFPCPRTYEFMNRYVKNWKTVHESKLPLMAGTIGTGAAYEFFSYLKEYEKLPSIQSMINSPDTVSIPGEPSTLYAITSLIGHHFSNSTSEPLMMLIKRLPKEFQIISLQAAVRQNRKLISNKDIKEWISKNSMELF